MQTVKKMLRFNADNEHYRSKSEKVSEVSEVSEVGIMDANYFQASVRYIK